MAKLVDDETAAIMIEPVQGEGGINIPPDGFLAGLRKLADEHELLLVFDEVQTGCGRTGQWFAYQHFGVTPDVMTLAKALCGGIAGGALLTTRRDRPQPAARHARGHVRRQSDRGPGRHRGHRDDREREPAGTRAGGSSEIFRQRLDELQGECELVREVRVLGVMIGVELSIDGTPVVQGCMDRQAADQLHARHGAAVAAGDEPERAASARGLRHSGRSAQGTGRDLEPRCRKRAQNCHANIC